MSSTVLTSLRNSCEQLDSEKVTERKKHIEYFKKELNRPLVQNQLDDNTNHGCGFAWDDVFRVVQRYMQKEVEYLKKNKGASSASLSTKDRKKQEIGSVFKWFIRQANKRGKLLKCSDVVQHILLLMKDKFTASAFGVDCCNVLLKDVLRSRKYYCDLPQKSWHELLRYFCKVLCDPVTGLSLDLVSRVMRSLLSDAVVQNSIHKPALFNFFSQILNKIRSEKSVTVVENVMAALNTFCQAVSGDCRIQLCKLGEDSLGICMHIWRNKSTATIKDEVLRFLGLQLSLHHPRGVLKEANGAYAADMNIWKSHLQQLYEFVLDEWRQAGTRMKLKGTGSREIVFKSALVDVAADVCHQVFCGDYSSVDMSKMMPHSSQSSLSGHFTQGGGGAKRRKVESGWSLLRETIIMNAQSAVLVPWLQLLRALLHKYPASVPIDQLHTLLAVLHQIQSDSKRSEVHTWVLQTMQALAVCQSQHTNLPATLTTALHSEWTKVWSCTIRTISLHTAESDGFDLLTCLLHRGIATPDKEHWRLFMTGSSLPTRNSVQLLAAILFRSVLPESHVCRSGGTLASGSVAKGSYPLRKQLLNWLLLNEEQEETGERLQLVKLLKTLPVTLVVEVLGVLTQRTTQSRQLVTSLMQSPSSPPLKTHHPTSQEVQTLILQSSFDLPSEDQCASRHADGAVIAGASCTVMSCVKQNLMQGLERLGIKVLDMSSSEVECVETLVHYSSLLSKTLAVLLEYNVLTEHEISQSKFADSLKTSMKRVATALRNLWHRSNSTTDKASCVQSIMAVIIALDGMFTWDQCAARQEAQCSAAWLADTCRCITSKELLDTLLEIVQKQGSNISPSRCLTSKMAAKDPFGDEIMDTNLDDDFDEDLKDDFDVNSNQAEETNAEKGCQSLLSPDVLSDCEVMALRTAHVLCTWCFTGVRRQDRDSRHRPGHPVYTSTDIQKKLLDLLDEEAFDPHVAFHVQMFRSIAESVIAANDGLSDGMLVGLLNALRMIVSKHRKDQELCREVLSLFSRLIPLLQCSTSRVSTDLKEARDKSLQLMAAFWKLQRDGEYTAPVRLAIAKCMHAFIFIDPMGEWTVLKSKVREKGQGDDCRTISKEFSVLLKDSCHSVRMFVASVIQCLFCYDSAPFTKELQNQAFDPVYQIAQDAMDVQEDLNMNERREEMVNRTASLLTTLSTVACYSPACEKKTVFALMQTIHLNGIQVSLMMKVLQRISGSLHYTSVIAFMESHLPYLIHQWLVEKYTLPQFPYQLLECSTEVEFYRKYHRVAVPHLVTLQCLDTVRDIAQTLDTDWIALLKESFPQSIARILPLFCPTRAAENEVDSADYQEKRSSAMLCFGALEEVLGKEIIDSLIQSQLDSIVVELLSMLYETSADDSCLVQFTSDTDPEPNPPFFSSYSIKATLDYLTNCHAGRRTLTLVSLLAKTQDNIQKILLALHIRISKSHRPHEKLRMLLAYHLFTSLLLEELATGLGGCWAMVLQDVIYTLVHTIHEEEKSVKGMRPRLAQPCIGLLHAVCVAGLRHCHEELGKHLDVLMGGLVPLVSKSDQVSKQALSLINMMVVENSEKLSSALQYLGPLPNYPSLANAKEAQTACKSAGGQVSLMEEVNNFLMVGNQQGGILRLEGMRHLHQQLANRKEELSVMVQQCAEGSDRTIIQLVTELVELSSSSNAQMDCMSEALMEEAGRCLGDIGAPNLSTVALHCDEKNTSYATALKEFATDVIMCRHIIIIHLLKEYLTDPNVDTVEAAAKCLKTVMATTSGQRCYEKYKDKNIDKLFYYLHPFIRQSKKKVTNKPAFQYSDTSFERTISDPSLWQLSDGDHSNWVRKLTVALIKSGGVKDEMLLMLLPICQVKVEFAEKVLPFLFHDILSSGNGEHRLVLSRCIETVFMKQCEFNNSRATTPMSMPDDRSVSQLGQKSIRVLLDVIHYLRTQDRPAHGHSKSTAWDNNFWLDVNYLVIAKAAQNCTEHFTCLLYTEIWCDVQRTQLGSCESASESLSQPSDIETLSALSNDSNINMQGLLLEAYSSIGEPDSVYGCGAGRLTDTYARIHTYEHEGEWNKAVCAYDLKLHSRSNHTGEAELGVLQAMQNQGLSHILTVYLKGLQSEDVDFGSDMTQFQYEAAWRNAMWDLQVEDRDHGTCKGFHQSVYTALLCLRDGETEAFTHALKEARLDTIQQLCHASIHSAYSVYPMLSRLRCLVEMEQAGTMSTKQMASVLQSWTCQLTLMDNDFKFAEPALALRTVLLQLCLEQRTESNHTQAYEGLVNHLKCQIEMARKAECFQIAEKSLANLQSLDRPAELPTNLCWWMLTEEAKIYWVRNEQTTAMHLMKALLDKLTKAYTVDPDAAVIHPQVLTIYGNWLAETNSESPNVIIEQYMEKAVDIYNARCDTTVPAIEAYMSLGWFADVQYQNIVNYMKSSEYEAKAALMKQAKKDHEELLAFGDKTSRYARTLLKQSEIDANELESMVQDKENYLQKAMECYLKCLQCGTIEHSMKAFRVCSLWFDNSSDDFLNELVHNCFEQIESHKFLPLLYQLAARMTIKTQDKQLFHQVLNQLIEKMGQDHPHHALPIILALANANKDAMITSRRTGRLARTVSMKDLDTSHADEARMQAAQDMLARLQLTKQCNQIICGLEKLSHAYIELAYWDVTDRKKETGPIVLPQNQPLTQLKHLQHVAMPTMEVPVDSTCRYDNIVYVERFEGYFKLAGGVNLPKIITCLGSDGKSRRQLVKGKDDLRQDAVMQQVFLLVNRLLQSNQETRKRRLQIRTYKIVPLSQRSGLLEWCEGTMPIGQYLVGDQKTNFGAHKRYRPKDWSSMECRRKMQLAHNCTEKGRKDRDYTSIMKRFRPVFRHFFLEKFPDPAVWFERRLAYTRSVAASSIVGYVVGLGDRHVQNILIDCNQAELVHIDLGVAFEQGRILPTPETVPFRLTRDLVDGMGIAGVEGVFRRCCEKTMDVMHHSQEALLTIIQVLLYDPLYVWTMSPHKAMALQQRRDRTDPEASELNTTATDVPDGEVGLRGQDSNDGSEVNKVAERVVLRLRQKLQGVEEGVAMSVKGQVNRLIQEARDPKNLCRLFPGWQPWI